jgi:hypothetical protein
VYLSFSVVSLGDAPLSRRIRTILSCPAETADMRGVQPVSLREKKRRGVGDKKEKKKSDSMRQALPGMREGTERDNKGQRTSFILCCHLGALVKQVCYYRFVALQIEQDKRGVKKRIGHVRSNNGTTSREKIHSDLLQQPNVKGCACQRLVH